MIGLRANKKSSDRLKSPLNADKNEPKSKSMNKNLDVSKTIIKQFQELLTETSINFITLTPDKIDEAITETLKNIGAFIGGVRSILFILSPISQELMKTNEWSSIDSSLITSVPQSITTKNINNLWKYLQKKKYFYVNQPNQIKDDFEDELKLFIGNTFQSIIITTVIYEESIKGILVITGNIGQIKKWSKEKILLLKHLTPLIYAVSRRKKSDENILQRKEYYKSFFHFVREGILISGGDGNIIDANQSAASMLGYRSPNELIGLPAVKVFFDPRDRIDLIKSLSAKETIEDIELVLKKEDGTPIHVLANGRVHRDSYNNILKIETILQDIDQWKKTEEMRNELEKRRSNFIATTSHELRTPLTSIKGFIEVLERYDESIEPDRKKKAFGLIHKNLYRLSSLINNVSDLSKIESDTFIINKNVANFCDFINDEMMSYKSLLGEQFEYFPCFESPVLVEIDEERIHQVFDNIINNAVKYTSSKKRRIIMSMGAYPELVRITISDNGPGIPPEDLENIFSPFNPLDTQSTESRKGIGVGLYLSREIVNQHGGRIYAQNKEQGTGAIFIIELPRRL